MDHFCHVTCFALNMQSRGWTPLLVACYYGHTVCAKLVVEAGADVNAVIQVSHWNISTPSHLALAECLGLSSKVRAWYFASNSRESRRSI